ncbi:MAG: hypothetical protein PUB21_04905 [Bacteroidales bacterium]|nr:hypothetical protein [Bacteroidales bacterium]
MAFIFVCVILFQGCNNDLPGRPEPVEPLPLVLDFEFMPQGIPMYAARVSEDVYTAFYENYIQTRILTPSEYNLTFKGVGFDYQIDIVGKWKKKEMLNLIPGKYAVTGTSYPSSQKGVQDTVSICFNDTVELTRESTSLLLTAEYDSYLLLFDADNFSDMYYEYTPNYGGPVKVLFGKVENVYYTFSRITSFNSGAYVRGRRSDLSSFSITLKTWKPRKGRYYYFNDIDNSFELPPMVAPE